MSLSKVDQIIDRIKVATEKSPIAVFRTPGCIGGRLDAIFSAPVVSQDIITANHINLIGIYTAASDVLPDMNDLRAKLTKELSVPAI